MFMSKILWTGHLLRGELSLFYFRFDAELFMFPSISNIFVIGEGVKPWISLPRGKGLKLTIAEERDVRRKRLAAAEQ